jgi:hypothetical protein
MHRFLMVLGITAGLAAPARAQNINCHINKAPTCQAEAARPLPKTAAAARALHEKIGGTPQGAAAVVVYALMVRAQDRALGDEMLADLIGDRVKPRLKGYLDHVDRRTHCVRSYAVGSRPDNDYKLDPTSVGLLFRTQTNHVGSVDSGEYKVFVCSSGMDSCSPMKMVRGTDGLWRANEMSSLAAMGCRPSAADPNDDQKRAREREQRTRDGQGDDAPAEDSY